MESRTFAEKIRDLIDERAGGSTRRFAAVIDPDDRERGRRNLQRWLSGRKPQQATIDRLAERLGVDPRFFDDDPVMVTVEQTVYDDLLREVREIRRDLSRIERAVGAEKVA